MFLILFQMTLITKKHIHSTNIHAFGNAITSTFDSNITKGLVAAKTVQQYKSLENCTNYLFSSAAQV